jgi:hypothetical protein
MAADQPGRLLYRKSERDRRSAARLTRWSRQALRVARAPRYRESEKGPVWFIERSFFTIGTLQGIFYE